MKLVLIDDSGKVLEEIPNAESLVITQQSQGMYGNTWLGLTPEAREKILAMIAPHLGNAPEPKPIMSALKSGLEDLAEGRVKPLSEVLQELQKPRVLPFKEKT